MTKRLSSKEVEELSVSKFKEFLIQSNKLSAEINTNDKQPIWDGDLLIYKDGFKDTAKEEVKKISLQIKGRQISNKDVLMQETSSYMVRTSDLKSYMHTPTLFVLVYIYIDKNNKFEECIFCNFFSKSQISNLLKKKKNTIEKTIKLYKKSDRPIQEFEIFILNSLDKFNSEVSFTAEQLDLIQQKYKFGNNDLLLKTNMPSGIVNNLIGLTGLSWQAFIPSADGLSPDLPLSSNIEISLDNKIQSPISIDGQIFFNSYTESAKKGKQSISIDNFFFLTFDGNKIYIKFNLCIQYLSQFKNQYEFIKKLLCYRTFKIGDADFPILLESNINESEKNEISLIKKKLEKIESLLERLRYVQIVLEYFDVKADPQITNLTERDLIHAEHLYNLFITNKTELSSYLKNINQLQIENKYFLYIELLNLHFVCSFTLQKDRTCSYIPINKKSAHVLQYQGKEISYFETISDDRLAELDNIPYEILYSYFSSLPEQNKEAERVNFFALRLILAADILHNCESSKEKRIQILSLAKKIEELLLSNDKLNMNYKLNLFQISARISKPTNEMKNELKHILSIAESPVTKCAVLILLKRFKEANVLLGQLTKKEKNNFKKLPIYNLLKNMDLFFKPNSLKNSAGTIKLVAKKV